MGPSQICGCPFREPRVFEIAHIYIYIYLYITYVCVCVLYTSYVLICVFVSSIMLYRQNVSAIYVYPPNGYFSWGKWWSFIGGGTSILFSDEPMWTTDFLGPADLAWDVFIQAGAGAVPGAWLVWRRWNIKSKDLNLGGFFRVVPSGNLT